MRDTVWIDDESNTKEDVLMAIESVGGTPEFCPTVTAALRYLYDRRDHPPRLVVLDYILPLGMTDQPFDLADLRRRAESVAGREVRRYTGLLILEAFQDIAPHTIAVSLASKEAVACHPTAGSVPHFSKLTLPFDWGQFEHTLRSIFRRKAS